MLIRRIKGVMIYIFTLQRPYGNYRQLLCGTLFILLVFFTCIVGEFFRFPLCF
jgi:hypothetical protein